MRSAAPLDPSTVVVLNPAAGGGVDAAEFAAAVRARLDCVVAVTSGTDDGRVRAAEAVRSGAKRVLAAGGDGTIREVVNGLVQASRTSGDAPILGVLPLGTGNDLARSIGIPLDLDAALDLLGGDVPTRPLDLLEVEVDEDRSWAVNAVIVGNGGRIGSVLEAPAKTFWGPLSYLRSAVEVALELESLPVAIALEGTEAGHAAPDVARAGAEVSGDPLEVLNVVVANGATAAGGVPIAPGASPHDGVLDVAVVTACELSEALGIGAALVGGRAPGSDAYRRRPGSRVRIESRSGAPFPLSVDGEPHTAERVVIALRPGRLRVLTGGG